MREELGGLIFLFVFIGCVLLYSVHAAKEFHEAELTDMEVQDDW